VRGSKSRRHGDGRPISRLSHNLKEVRTDGTWGQRSEKDNGYESAHTTKIRQKRPPGRIGSGDPEGKSGEDTDFEFNRSIEKQPTREILSNSYAHRKDERTCLSIKKITAGTIMRPTRISPQDYRVRSSDKESHQGLTDSGVSFALESSVGEYKGLRLFVGVEPEGNPASKTMNEKPRRTVVTPKRVVVEAS